MKGTPRELQGHSHEWKEAPSKTETSVLCAQKSLAQMEVPFAQVKHKLCLFLKGTCVHRSIAQEAMLRLLFQKGENETDQTMK